MQLADFENMKMQYDWFNKQLEKFRERYASDKSKLDQLLTKEKAEEEASKIQEDANDDLKTVKNLADIFNNANPVGK